MAGPGYVTLATGAGAGEGLETLLARMRAEETLRNQGRSVDIAQQNANTNSGELGERTREWDQGGPGREANVNHVAAETRETNANAGILENKGTILGGLGNMLQSAPGAASLDNPSGRLRMSLAGITPSGVFPNESSDERNEAAYGAKVGLTPGTPLNWDQRISMLKSLPNTVLAAGRLDNSRENTDISRQSLDMRRQLFDLQKGKAERDLAVLPVDQRALAIAEFNNRINHDVQSAPWYAKFIGGETGDSASQIEAIKQDVMKKYGMAPGPGSGHPNVTGDDLDAVLMQRRRARRGQ